MRKLELREIRCSAQSLWGSEWWSGIPLGFLGGTSVKNLPPNAIDAKDMGSIPGREGPRVGNGRPLYYSFWIIPWTKEPGKLQSMGLQRVGHNWALTTTGIPAPELVPLPTLYKLHLKLNSPCLFWTSLYLTWLVYSLDFCSDRS